MTNVKTTTEVWFTSQQMEETEPNIVLVLIKWQMNLDHNTVAYDWMHSI